MGSFDLSEVDPLTITMSWTSAGSTTSIASIAGKSLHVGDVDRNGVADAEVCFAREDLARLFRHVRGRQSAETLIAGTLTTGDRLLDLAAAPSGAKQVPIGGSAMPGEELATGVYFYCIETADGVATGRFAVLK